MKANEKLHSLALMSATLILFLILVSSTASASITETKITNNGAASQPAIYANKIAWTEKQNGTDKTNIYLFDLSTKKKTQVTTSGLASSPKIYDSKIVWQDSRNGGSNIYMYDFRTKKETKITNSGWAYSPYIYGNVIVWNDNRNYDHNSIDPIYDVYMYDISTKKETEVAKQNVSKREKFVPSVFSFLIFFFLLYLSKILSGWLFLPVFQLPSDLVSCFNSFISFSRNNIQKNFFYSLDRIEDRI